MHRRNAFTLLVVCAGLLVRQSHGCDQEDLEKCTKTFRGLKESNVVGLGDSIAYLQDTCPTMLEGIQCLDNFTTTCSKQPQKFFIEQMFRGPRDTIVQLCTDTPLRTEYLRHAPCLQRIKDDTPHQCQKNQELKPASAKEGMRQSCCQLKEMMKCVYGVYEAKCGPEAANVMDTAIRTLTGGFMTLCNFFAPFSSC